jgi:NADH-quinone oxidoreductase subunit J
MTPIQLIFFIIAAVTLVAACGRGCRTDPSALWLIVTLFGVSVFYVLLNAGFFAVVQVVVYIGAIAILFIFAAMLTRRVMQDAARNSMQLLAGGLVAPSCCLAGCL